MPMLEQIYDTAPTKSKLLHRYSEDNKNLASSLIFTQYLIYHHKIIDMTWDSKPIIE